MQAASRKEASRQERKGVLGGSRAASFSGATGSSVNQMYLMARLGYWSISSRSTPYTAAEEGKL